MITPIMKTGHLLTVEEMYRADAAAIAGGVFSLSLMEAAGGAIARTIRAEWSPRQVAVLCGPGNNGGDGFVAARLLSGAGWPVRVGLLGDRNRLTGDAAANAQRWNKKIHSFDESLLEGNPLVIDALFGAGLRRAVDGMAKTLIGIINKRSLDCVGVDIPSGVHGDTGQILGNAPRCQTTVTFFRPKPGHLLLPGRSLSGNLVVADIGVPQSVLKDIRPQTMVNSPGLWLDSFPWPMPESHKYSRGHVVVAGGGLMTGAARLAAAGARRAGAGLLTIAAPAETFAIYAIGEPGVLVSPISGLAAFSDLLSDERKNVVLVGPGNGVEEGTRQRALMALGSGKACVLDADALSVFANTQKALFEAISGPCVLTPHAGEFSRLFQKTQDRLLDVRTAARISGAVVVLKGSDTVIAAPDGRALVNANAPPWLATGGSGDVLSGMAAGLLAQEMPAFEAASAAVWLHGAAAEMLGPGLIAEDLPGALPKVLKNLQNRSWQS